MYYITKGIHMYKINSIRIHNKISPLFAGIVALLISLLVLSGSVLAWGPSDRVTFTKSSPASYVTFNSITDQTPYGDERNFMVVREAGTNNKYTDEVAVEGGKEYEVYVHFHNNASLSLNASGQGIATNTRLRINQDSIIKANSNLRITGIISADNAIPKEVWDETFLTSKEDVAVRYVPDSATIHSLGAVNGQKLPNDLFGASGTLLGYDSLNGKLPGCNEFSGYVTYRLKVDKPSFTVSKTVRLDGAKEWVETVKAEPGQKVNFLIEYDNIGSMEQKSTIVRDKLPANVQYVAGTTKLKNANNPTATIVADGITTSGIQIGSYAPGANALMSFSAIMPAKEKLNCGTNKIRNIVEILTDNGNKSDGAEITIDVECKPQECKPGIPEGDERCSDVAVPVELPSTGPAQTALVLASLTGVASLVVYEVQKRRKARLAFASHIAGPTLGLLDDGLDDDDNPHKLYVRRDDKNSNTDTHTDDPNNNPFSGGEGQ